MRYDSARLSLPDACFHFHNSSAIQQCEEIRPKAVYPSHWHREVIGGRHLLILGLAFYVTERAYKFLRIEYLIYSFQNTLPKGLVLGEQKNSFSKHDCNAIDLNQLFPH